MREKYDVRNGNGDGNGKLVCVVYADTGEVEIKQGSYITLVRPAIGGPPEVTNTTVSAQ